MIKGEIASEPKGDTTFVTMFCSVMSACHELKSLHYCGYKQIDRCSTSKDSARTPVEEVRHLSLMGFLTDTRHHYLRQGGYVFIGISQFVC